MCGIAGIFDTRETSRIDEGLLARMNEAQFHRGPDEGGIHIEPGVGLAHRRLSIIDLSSGQQPLFNEDGSVVVVFNGEIYNFPELTKELTAVGHVFKTHSDTEVIVHAWEEWGESCVNRFRGMFAFSIWDRNRKTLFLARDRMGIKPLHYTLLPDGKLIFSSELKSIMLNPALPRNIDPMAIEEYFSFGYIPDPKTIYKNIFKLEPGYTLTIKRGEKKLTPRQYWDVPFVSNGITTVSDATEGLIEHLEDAVKIRMLAEVPLGAFLSGGVDSSAVVAMMAQSSSGSINTCSISFSDPSFDEAEYASQVAARYKTNHQVEQVNPDDFDLIDKLAGLYDEPYADSSAMPTYRVCELAKKRVTVALSGDGGDENFAGYRRYKWHMIEEQMRSLMPGSIRKPVFGALGRLYPKIDWAPRMFRAKSTFQALERDAVEGYFHNFSILPDALRKKLYSRKLNAELDGYHGIEVFKRYLKDAPDHPLSMVQYLDFKTYLPGDILTKVDRASMAHALEVRVPILDHVFVEWISGLSPEIKLKGQEGKYVLKKSLEPHLSNDILYRKKMGFAVPLAKWFRGSLRERVRQSLLGKTMQETGLFNQAFIQNLVDQHQSGKRDYSAAIWSLLMFESFFRNSINTN